MAVYMVERRLPGTTIERLAAAQRAMIAACERSTAGGNPVYYIRSIFVPEQALCLCLFKAPDPATVREVNQAAGIPFLRVVEALDLRP
jgi:hypothetical protein